MASSNSKSSTQRDLQSSDTGNKEIQKSRSCWGMADSKNSSSSMVGLKLGKRTYFEDGHDTQGEDNSNKGKVNSNNSLSAAVATTSVTTVVNKKGRGSSQSGGVPKCQVEGCNADLSGSKEYHKRHKVCEEHSKTPKCIVNSQEQRFCQQCSRFHLLPEFDEGKRSCRRRLAGHNERRRKPQPDALAAYSMGNVSNFQAAYQRLGVTPSILVNNHGEPLGYGSSGSGSSSSTPASTWGRMGAHQQFLSKQLVESLSAEKLLLLLQNSKRSTGLPTISTSAVSTSTSTPTVRSTNQDNMKLTLSSSSSRDVHGGRGGISSDSRRALSLLSSSEAWNTSTSTKPYGTHETSQFTMTGSSSTAVDTEQDHQERYGCWKYTGY